MKKNLLFIGLLLSVIQVISAQTTLKERLEKHVYTLADDSMKGRQAGSIYGQQAAEYIVNQWKEIGITPYKEDTYYQPFSSKYQNIIGILEGNDPLLKDEYIVVGAHYDHLGFKLKGNDTIVYNGADDNASGIATLIELSRALKEIQSSLHRSVILVAFDAEEIGLFGSQNFVKTAFIPLEKIKLMFSVDMVGWHKTSGKVEYEGSGTIYNGKDLLLNSALIPEGLHVKLKKFENSVFTATDTEAFAKKGIPTLAVTTGLKSPYHKPEDDANLIDYEGLTLITEHLKNIVLTVSQDSDYKPSGKLAAKHRTTQKKVIFGLSANIGTNKHHYTKGALEGKDTNSYGIGLLSQFNFGIYAIRPEVHYDRIRAQYPEGKIATNNITVPLNFVLQTPPSGPIGADVFLGGYYSHRFSGRQGKEEIDFTHAFYQNEGGISFGFSIDLKLFKFGYTARNALTNFTRHTNVDNAHIRNQTSYFTLTHLF
jgi:hypothetical protein